MNTREIIVVAAVKTLDANHRDEFPCTLYDIVERSRIAPECLSYELFSRAEDENTLVLFQMWSTREASEQNWAYRIYLESTQTPICSRPHGILGTPSAAVVKNLRSVFLARPTSTQRLCRGVHR